MGQSELLDFQKKTFSDLKNILSFTKKIVVLKGDSGVGKSHLIRYVTSEFPISSTLFIIGDSYYAFDEFYIFRKAFLSLNIEKQNNWKKDLLVESAKDLPKFSNTISYLVNIFLTKNISNTIFADEKYNEIYVLLKKMIKSGRNTLIFDNLYQLDSSSTQFIKNLILNINQVDNLKTIVLVLNEQKDKEMLQWLEGIRIGVEFITLSKPLKTDIMKFISLIEGPRNDSENSQTIELINAFCDGNLELLKLILSGLNSNVSKLNNESTGIDESNLFMNIINNKLEQFGDYSIFIDNVLTAASCIGLNFGLAELEYVLEEKSSKCQDAVKCSGDAKLTILSGDKSYRFTHSLIRDLFIEKAKVNSCLEEYYLKVEKCLQYMRPSTYFNRAQYAYDGKDYKKASILYVLGLLQSLRDNNNSNNFALFNSYLSRIYPEHAIFYEHMEIAYGHFNCEDYHKCLKTLRLLLLNNPIEFEFEKVYLSALSSKKIRLNLKNMDEIRYNLEYFKIELINESIYEHELWSRCTSTLLAIYYDCYHDKKETTILNRYILDTLEKRSLFDPMALHHINVIRRKSKMLFSAEIAVRETQKSLDFFRNTSYLKQIDRSICNHAGNLITLGRYDEAFALLNGILGDSEFELKNSSFYLINNAILSGFYSNNISAHEGILLFNKLKEISMVFDDVIVIQNNYCVLKAMNNELEYAVNELEKLYSNPCILKDDYFVYFIGSNLVVAYILTNSFDKATNLFNLIKEKIPFICENEESFLLMRESIIENTLIDNNTITIQEFEQEFTKTYTEMEESWLHWGRPFITSDLQYWSES